MDITLSWHQSSDSAIRQTFNSRWPGVLGCCTSCLEHSAGGDNDIAVTPYFPPIAKTWLFRKSYPDIIMWTRICLSFTINPKVVLLLGQFMTDWLIKRISSVVDWRVKTESWRKVRSDCDVVISSGRVFQTQGPATENARSPTVEHLTDGTIRRLVPPEHNVCWLGYTYLLMDYCKTGLISKPLQAPWFLWQYCTHHIRRI